MSAGTRNVHICHIRSLYFVFLFPGVHRLALFCALLCFPIILRGQAYDTKPERQLAIADSLFAAENLFDAVTEYERFLFFAARSSQRAYAHEQIGKAYRSGGKLEEAKESFSQAYRLTTDIGIRHRLTLDLLRTHLLRRDFQSARTLLDNLAKDTSASRGDESRYWEGWYFIFADDWAKAEERFAGCDSGAALAPFCARVREQRYSPTIARTLSTFIPGAGSLYTGHYFNAAISLAWNILFGYLTVSAFSDNRIFDGIMTGEFLWFRFYSGSIENAEEFVTLRNAEITRSAMQYLEYEYQGTKP